MTMDNEFTEQTIYRAALIENAALKKELKDKVIELKVAKDLQSSVTKTLDIVKDFGGVSTKDVLVMINDFYHGDVK